jgi:hypothetical protein
MSPLTSCELTEARIRDLLGQLTPEKFRDVSAEIVAWINSLRPSAEDKDGVVDMIYTAAISCNSPPTHTELIARTCRQLFLHSQEVEGDTQSGTEFLDLLVEKCSREFYEAKGLLDTRADMWLYKAGSWPQFIALLKFVGELFNMGLLEEDDILRAYIYDLSQDPKPSDLKIEGLCTLIRTAGHCLDQGKLGRLAVDRCMKCISDYKSSRCVAPPLFQLIEDVTILRAHEWVPLAGEAECSFKKSNTHPAPPNLPPYTFSPPTTPSSGNNPNNESCYHGPDPRCDVCNLPHHDKFYFDDGNLLLACDGTLFRVHSGILSRSSPVLRKKLSPRSLAASETHDGCRCVHLPDTASDMTTLLNLVYDLGFPPRHKTPNFPTYSSILRITTKYEMSATREQILVDIEGAYPTSFENFESSKVLGETVFGDPKPSPNAVLKLFDSCKVTFALPYAYYRACKGGLLRLTDPTPVASLPPKLLVAAVKGLGHLKAAEWNTAKKVLFGFEHQPPCKTFSCYSGMGIRTEVTRGQPIFQKLLESVAHPSNDMATEVLEKPKIEIHSPSSKPVFCNKCLATWNDLHKNARKEVWESLPVTFHVEKPKGWN